MNILGISAFYHDSAACLIQNGQLISAAQEERFSRKKFDNAFPHQAIEYCLSRADLSLDELDYVAFYEKPHRKLNRIWANHLQYAPRSWKCFFEFFNKWVPERLAPDLFLRERLGGRCHAEILFFSHHESHAASAYFASGWDDAAILTIDGVGEWATTTIGIAEENDIRLIKQVEYPHSLGLLYSTFTYYLGFKVNSGEYKIMGLAPYGEPRYADLILKNLVDFQEDGSFVLNMKYFGFGIGETMTNGRFHRLFGGVPRNKNEPLNQRHMDLAASVQVVVEKGISALAAEAKRVTGKTRLCLAGGVALNCVANSKLLRSGEWDEVFVPPAPGDAGGALGAAYLTWYRFLGQNRPRKEKEKRFNPFIGPSFDTQEIHEFLDQVGATYVRYDDEDKLLDKVAAELDQGKVVGWFQGRMEWGPRALGARSILGDPRRADMQRTINLKVKFRESFRPFAPAVLEERVGDYFEWSGPSPYMLFVAPVSDRMRISVLNDGEGIERLHVRRSEIPAVTHVDNSARLQTVGPEDQMRFYKLLQAFETLTDCGVLVNTSFNIRGEPIVCTPQEAYRSFMYTGIDVLVLGDFVLEKSGQTEIPGATKYRTMIEED